MMDYEPDDEQVVHLLSKLKDVNGEYPPEMLESRRQAYLKNMAGLGMGVGLGEAIKNAAKNGNGTGFTSSAAGKLLEIVLVVAIVAETSTLAYFYRRKVADFFQSISTTIEAQGVGSPPVVKSPSAETLISSAPTQTVLGFPTGTPMPGSGILLNNDGSTALAGVTPGPNGNNGNHYGQTPKPDRTKVNNNNKPPKNKPGKDNKNKPPKGNNK